jgi:putative endonuclease
MTSYSKYVGSLGEVAVCRYVTNLGFEVVERNYTIRGGEVDIIACNNEYLLFIEVKTRITNALTSGWQAITHNKRVCIVRTASHYCKDRVIRLQPRFDVAEVTIDEYQNVLGLEYYPNAFDTTDLGVYIPIY